MGNIDETSLGLTSVHPSKVHKLLQKTTLLGVHKKQAMLNEKLVGLCYHDYSFTYKCSRHILGIRVLLKIGVEFGLNLGMLYCWELDEYPYRISHNESGFYFIIMFGTKLHGSINMHLLHDAL